MNREIHSFTKRYWATHHTDLTWYGKFFSKHLYTTYYSFLDKLIYKYNHTYKKAFQKELKRYNKIKKTWNRSERSHVKAS